MRKYNNKAYLYMLPALALLVIFVFYPFVQTIIRSLYATDNMGNNTIFIGLENYTDLLSSSSFWNSIRVTFIYVLIVVVLGVLLGFATALLCRVNFPAIRLFSASYSLPIAIASSGMALVFRVMLNQSVGILNVILKTNINWLADPSWALLRVGVLTAWLNSGLNFLYFSSGLAGIDDSLYEAASMDGANSINQFKNVTLPSIRPIMFFVVVTNIINAFQSFGQIKLLTQGGPGESTNVIVHDIYKNAFMNYRYGYASAESVVLFFIVMVLTIIAFRSNGVKNAKNK